LAIASYFRALSEKWHETRERISYSRLGRNRLATPFIRDEDFRNPTLSPTPVTGRKVWLTGSCVTVIWKDHIEEYHPQIEIEHQILNHISKLQDKSSKEIESVQFQIVQLPLRFVIPELEYFGIKANADGLVELRELLDRCVERLRSRLDAGLKYNRQAGLTTFVLNFARPQSNPLGMLAPKYDLSNFSFFVDQLNQALAQMIAAEKGVYLIDFDEIAATIGKRYILDDVTLTINHGAFISPGARAEDLELTPYGSTGAIFAPRRRAAALAIFHECLAAYKILAATEKIKLVIFDVDGTLWRGVAAEGQDVGQLGEGWPLGVLEAAAFLRRRGILLAIASKNDPEIATQIWNGVYGRVFPLSNFVSVKFSWRHKIESIHEILKETNLLPGNVLFVDDNPVERARVKEQFPDMRLLEGPIATWRRTLLWAHELQVPYVTEESAMRAESLQMNVMREELRKTISDEEYLKSLQVKVGIDRLNSTSAGRFPRAFELLNKTNQFNTTGRRWSAGEIEAFFASGGYALIAQVSDRFSNYGLTALALCAGSHCEQMVMSCRVFGLGIEKQLFEDFASRARTIGQPTLAYRVTSKNGPVKGFLQEIGAAGDASGRRDTLQILQPEAGRVLEPPVAD
jgi:FkbH-like protein